MKASVEAANRLFDRYQAEGRDEDLEAAVDTARRAMAKARHGSTRWSQCAATLGTILRARFERWGDRADIDESIACHSRALQVVGLESFRAPSLVTNLANALWSRYLRFGSWSDLSQAADLHRMTADAFDMGASARNNYALVLRDMYEYTGELGYLEDAATTILAAAADPQVDVPIMNTLALVMFTRHRHTGDLRDLDLIIELLVPVLDVATGRDRAICFQNLGNALMERHLATGDLDDLEKGVTAHASAVRVLPHDHPARPAHLDDWASALLLRWRATKGAGDVAKAVEIRENLLDSVAADDSERVKFLNNLGLALIETATGPERVTTVFRDACRIGLDINPGEVLSAAGTWGDWAARRSSWAEAVTAYEFGMSAVRNLFRAQLLRRHKELWLVSAGRFAAEAAYAHARAADPQSAVQNLERGRSLLLAEVLERDRADLSHLADLGHGDLRARFVRAVEGLY